jgi:hypothetical protein
VVQGEGIKNEEKKGFNRKRKERPGGRRGFSTAKYAKYAKKDGDFNRNARR